MIDSLDIATLAAAYRNGTATPADTVAVVLDRIARDAANPIWISRVDDDALRVRAANLVARGPAGMPLWGIPFAVKDNIDAAGLPTTAACAAFGYTPHRSATVVQRLLDAGAMLIGKTNLDQFATGLVGTRSPWGAVRNAFDERYISGGSSSGSAVAAARGHVSFALGTDTAGSGRVPAAFNNLVGLKPTLGSISTCGVVPACRTLDCVSIFALTTADAALVFDIAAAPDPGDPYSRVVAPHLLPEPADLRVGVPRAAQCSFFGDGAAEAAFATTIGRMERLGARIVEINFAPFRAAADLLYGGPWVAERYHAVHALIEARPEALHPVTRTVIEQARRYDAVNTFDAFYRMQALKVATQAAWRSIDVLLTPTAGTIWTQDDVAAEPVARNTDLGFYTNFVNLLDLTAVAVPSSLRPDGLPFGVTLVAPAGSDRALARLAGTLHDASGLTLGAGGWPMPAAGDLPRAAEGVVLAVSGAHMTGLPLNERLTARGARRIGPALTAPRYRLYALPGGPPSRPGMVRAPDGAAIEVELWRLDHAGLGAVLAEIPSPLGLGRVELADGRMVTGFVCEAWATAEARDITAYGGWRAFLAAGR
ncbi:MAG: allophanate hydrolase [Alphaproteobacteria bacterium]|nr:allophanate hydrolase [Alphaproteobacteria bacterium]